MQCGNNLRVESKQMIDLQLGRVAENGLCICAFSDDVEYIG